MTTAALASNQTRLADLRPGTVARVDRIADEDLAALAEVGLREGSVVVVERRLPFGGPVLLELGPARIAVARAVASRTLAAASAE